VPVHYCLGLGEEKYARLADPWNFEPFAGALRADIGAAPFDLLGLMPSFAWTEPNALSSHAIAQLSFKNHKSASAFRDLLDNSNLAKRRVGGKKSYGFGHDPIISAMDSWSPMGSDGGIFGDRGLADRLTGVRALWSVAGDGVPEGGATGEGVNVVIVDRGLERNWVKETIERMASRRGLSDVKAEPDVLGWTRYETTVSDGRRIRRPIFPGATGSDHAQMIARNILAIAPKATIWDAPLLPLQDEEDAPPRISTVAHLFHWIKQAVAAGSVWSWDTRANAQVELRTSGPWVVVNAWGVLDPESDPAFKGYADDKDHLVVNDVARLDAARIDVVFAAGNCGEPCPDPRCGSEDTGPNCSIFGFNAQPGVLTVGAVRADGLPVAQSAQGKSRVVGLKKPDLCAPSHFREDDDASECNTGTSGACAYAAGVLAALRSLPKGKRRTPEKMRKLLRDTAQPAGAGWDPRLGFGIIDAKAALGAL